MENIKAIIRSNCKIEIITSSLIFVVIAGLIIMQGGFYPIQWVICAFAFILIGIFLIFQRGLIIERSSVIFLIVICICYLIPVLTFGADMGHAMQEILKWFCFIFPFLVLRKKYKDTMILGIYYGCSVIAIIGLLAFAGIIKYESYATAVDGSFRLQSTIGYANTTAVLCGIGVFLGVFFWNRSNKKNIIHIIFASLNLLAMILTFSKFGYACFFAALVFLLWFKGKIWRYCILILGMLAIVFVAFLFSTGRESIILGSTLVSRLIYWQDAIGLIIHNPLGIGAKTWGTIQYGIQSSDYSVQYIHNGYLQIALEAGPLALLSLLIFVVYKLKKILTKKENWYNIGILIIVLLHIFVDFDLSYLAVLVVLGIFISTAQYNSKTNGCNIDENKCKLSIAKRCLVILTFAIFAFIASISVPAIIYESRTLNGYNEIIVAYNKSPKDMMLLAQLYSISYSKGDVEKAYEWSRLMVVAGPRKQVSYDAYYVALERIYQKTKDVKYLHERDELYVKVDKINSTMNYLVKYLTAHQKINLPKGDLWQ